MDKWTILTNKDRTQPHLHIQAGLAICEAIDRQRQGKDNDRDQGKDSDRAKTKTGATKLPHPGLSSNY